MLFVTYTDVENENESYVQIDLNVRYDLPFEEDKRIDENFREIVRKANKIIGKMQKECEIISLLEWSTV